MITNTQFVQTTRSHFVVALAMAQAVFGLIKSIIAMLLFWACPSMTSSLPEYPRMAVTTKVERNTSRYSMMVAPSSSVSFSSSSSTLVETSLVCDNAIAKSKKSGAKRN
ncbi:uncharacterized protein EV420DRAFT_1506043 [Desarmillaria tabescens]|uniref:Uncharacterized protein n=1 Tax=Armillaria tabescens TaxID=1929756 RepID=A0AA39TYP0_ARMTA|nr:uncharacterized protein EV420DRAFT_1506043 [Desarmillaria tabescens]KAK0466904.1 hypothetical protein EV420DRAFT_1506043 [Desarmillaria tabescens]